MTSSQLMLAAIGKGLEDDATTSAALDAIREESNCSLLAAVLEVARVWKVSREARELTEAVTHLAADSPLREDLEGSILAECLNVPTGSAVTIVTVEGDQWPRATVTRDWAEHGHPAVATVTVGARWVKCEANRIMIERERSGKKPKTRRRALSFRNEGGAGK